MQLEDGPNNALGSSGQPGRMLRHILAEDSAGSLGTITEMSSLDSTLSSRVNTSQQWRRQELGVEEQTRLEGHHKLPKWARWAAESTSQSAALIRALRCWTAGQLIMWHSMLARPITAQEGAVLPDMALALELAFPPGLICKDSRIW